MGAIVTFKKPISLQQAVSTTEQSSLAQQHSNRFRMTEARIEAAPLPEMARDMAMTLMSPALLCA